MVLISCIMHLLCCSSRTVRKVLLRSLTFKFRVVFNWNSARFVQTHVVLYTIQCVAHCTPKRIMHAEIFLLCKPQLKCTVGRRRVKTIKVKVNLIQSISDDGIWLYRPAIYGSIGLTTQIVCFDCQSMRYISVGQPPISI